MTTCKADARSGEGNIKKPDAELEEASAILAYLQNIEDEDDAETFVLIWLDSVNEGLQSAGEEVLDIEKVRGYIAETDTRFVEEVNDQ